MLAELIHPLAAMGAQEWPYRPRPSSAGPNQCVRKLVYHALEFPRRQAHGRFLVVLDDSSWHEELTLNWIEQSAFQLRDRQTEVICGETVFAGEPYTILGHIDGIVTDLLGIDRLLEHKAIEHFIFQRYAEGDYPPSITSRRSASIYTASPNSTPTSTKPCSSSKTRIRAPTSNIDCTTRCPTTDSL